MTFLALIFVLVLQAGALWCGACAYLAHTYLGHRLGGYNRRSRNRWAFACVVLSVAALLTAYRIGVGVASC